MHHRLPLGALSKEALGRLSQSCDCLSSSCHHLAASEPPAESEKHTPLHFFMTDLRLSQVNHPGKLNTLLRSLKRLFFDELNRNMLPAVGPEIQPMALPMDRGRAVTPHSASVSSLSGSAPVSRTITRSSSSVSIPFDDSEVDVVRVEGVRHAEGRLEAR